jgi:hypothetical protein
MNMLFVHDIIEADLRKKVTENDCKVLKLSCGLMENE